MPTSTDQPPSHAADPRLRPNLRSSLPPSSSVPCLQLLGLNQNKSPKTWHLLSFGDFPFSPTASRFPQHIDVYDIPSISEDHPRPGYLSQIDKKLQKSCSRVQESDGICKFPLVSDAKLHRSSPNGPPETGLELQTGLSCLSHARRFATAADSSLPSARPSASSCARFITFPISAFPVAPVSAAAVSMIASIASSVRAAGR